VWVCERKRDYMCHDSFICVGVWEKERLYVPWLIHRKRDYERACLRVYVFTLTRTHTHTRTHTGTRVCKYLHTRIYSLSLTHTHAHTWTHTHAHTHAHAHAHTHAYAHTCTHTLAGLPRRRAAGPAMGRHSAGMNESWHTHIPQVCVPCMCHDSFICLCRDSFIYVCAMIHLYVGHACVVTHSNVRHDSLNGYLDMPWLIHMCDMTH